MIVNVNELRKALNYLATIEDWKFTGLSNTTYAEFHVLQDDSVVE